MTKIIDQLNRMSRELHDQGQTGVVTPWELVERWREYQQQQKLARIEQRWSEILRQQQQEVLSQITATKPSIFAYLRRQVPAQTRPLRIRYSINGLIQEKEVIVSSHQPWGSYLPTDTFWEGELFWGEYPLDLASYPIDHPKSWDQESDLLSWTPKLESFQVSLSIQTLTGKVFSLPMHLKQGVDDLKEQITAREGLPPDQQRLVWEQRQLPEEASLWEVGIRTSSLIHLVLRLYGGKGIDLAESINPDFWKLDPNQDSGTFTHPDLVCDLCKTLSFTGRCYRLIPSQVDFCEKCWKYRQESSGVVASLWWRDHHMILDPRNPVGKINLATLEWSDPRIK